MVYPTGALLFGGLGLTHWCSGAVGAAVGMFGPGEALWLVTRRKGTRCLASAQQMIPVRCASRRGEAGGSRLTVQTGCADYLKHVPW